MKIFKFFFDGAVGGLMCFSGLGILNIILSALGQSPVILSAMDYRMYSYTLTLTHFGAYLFVIGLGLIYLSKQQLIKHYVPFVLMGVVIGMIYLANH